MPFCYEVFILTILLMKGVVIAVESKYIFASCDRHFWHAEYGNSLY